MGNCHFKTDFEAEQMAGKFPFPPPFHLTPFSRSSDKGQLSVPVLHRQGGFRQGVASGAQEDKTSLCHEGNVQGPSHYQAQRQVSDERAPDTHAAEQSLPGKHVLRFSGQGELVSAHGHPLGG